MPPLKWPRPNIIGEKSSRRGGALAVGQKLVDSVDEARDVGLCHIRGGAGGEGFATVNLVGVAGIKNARHLRRELRQRLTQLYTRTVRQALVEYVKVIVMTTGHV